MNNAGYRGRALEPPAPSPAVEVLHALNIENPQNAAGSACIRYQNRGTGP